MRFYTGFIILEFELKYQAWTTFLIHYEYRPYRDTQKICNHLQESANMRSRTGQPSSDQIWTDDKRIRLLVCVLFK